jgi:hypothetical protein
MSWLWFRVYLALDDGSREALREALYAAADPRAPGYGAYRCVGWRRVEFFAGFRTVVFSSEMVGG